MKKVTILITNYNYGRFLSRCIRSCLSQTMSKEEYTILIVDDKSTDNSLEILSQWEGRHNIKIIKNKINLGLGNSCNIGLSQCETPYVVRVDADDYVSEDFCKTLYLYASTNGFQAVSCDYYEVDFNETQKTRRSAISMPIACGILFRTDTLDYIGGYSNLRINEEVELIERYSKFFKIKNVEIPLYRYYKHADSLSNKGVK